MIRSVGSMTRAVREQTLASLCSHVEILLGRGTFLIFPPGAGLGEVVGEMSHTPEVILEKLNSLTDRTDSIRSVNSEVNIEDRGATSKSVNTDVNVDDRVAANNNNESVTDSNDGLRRYLRLKLKGQKIMRKRGGKALLNISVKRAMQSDPGQASTAIYNELV